MSNFNINEMIDNLVDDENAINNGNENNRMQSEPINSVNNNGVAPRERINIQHQLQDDNFGSAEGEGEGEMADDELAFLKRADIGKGADGIAKYIRTLRSAYNLFLPESGLSKLDLACLSLGKVEKIQNNQVLKTQFEEQIKGVTEQDNLMTWLLEHEQTRKYIFKRVRLVHGSNIRKLMPTRVNIEQLQAVALNFGGKQFDDYQQAAQDKKHGKKQKKQKQKVPVFLMPDPKQILPSHSKNKSTFAESLANSMDKQIALDKNPLQAELQEHCVVNSQADFQKFLNQVRNAKLDLTGRESALEVVQMLQLKMRAEKDERFALEEKLRKDMFSERDKLKEELVSIFADLHFDKIEPAWFADFTRDQDLKAFLDFLKSAIKRLKNTLNEPTELSIAKEIIADYIKTYLSSRIQN